MPVMIKPVIMMKKPIIINTVGITFSPSNQRPEESLRKQADGMMKIRGVALRAPWMEEDNISKIKRRMN